MVAIAEAISELGSASAAAIPTSRPRLYPSLSGHWVRCARWKRYITSQTSWSTSTYAPPRRRWALDLKFG